MRPKARLFPLCLSAALLLGGAAGCELIAGVDRTLIDQASGSGGAAQGGGGSGGQGQGGMGGAAQGGAGGMGGGGGMGAMGGMGGMGGSGGAGGQGGQGGGVGGSGGVGGAGGAGGQGGQGGSGIVCTTPGDCPPTGSACAVAICPAGLCGINFVAVGTPIAAQTAGDCHEQRCDGNGAVSNDVDDTDLPNDGNACTSDACAAGVPTYPALPSGTACGAGGAMLCNGMGACVECLSPTTCAGQDTECQQRTCNAGVCGVSFAPSGTPTSSQMAGDCLQNQCDGAGAIVSAALDSDVPVDGLTCTSDVCVAGSPSNPPAPSGAPCTQTGGVVCNGAGNCVQCVIANDCPGVDTECQMRTCSSNLCGVSNAPAGQPLVSQAPGDCHEAQCDGTGGVTSAVLDSDIPVDGIECTDDVCTAGSPSNPNRAPSTPCTQGGGVVCSGSGMCVECVLGAECVSGVCTGFACAAPSCTDNVHNGSETDVDCGGGTCPPCGVGEGCGSPTDCQSGLCSAATCLPPAVVSTVPADGAPNVAVSSTITITFTTGMLPATLSAQTTGGACTGSIQVSSDDFVTCIGFNAAAPVLSGGNAVATLTPAPALSFSSTYKIRVTTTVTDASGNPLDLDYTSTSGFTTVGPPPGCNNSVVISQVYGAGGNAGATYMTDFIELHNRGTAPVSLAGWSVQYASAAGTTWTPTALPVAAVIAPGGYFLVWEAGGAAGMPLPASDAAATIAMAAGAGKVAVVSSTTALTGACPLTNPAVVDFIGYGATANCYEGTGPAPTPSTTLSDQRGDQGCTDTNQNATNFVAAPVMPRNSSSPPYICACAADVTANESNAGYEADTCVLESPASVAVQVSQSTPLIYGRIFEAGLTEAAGPNAAVSAQLGFGPETVNPTTQSGWTFFPASYDAQFVNDDGYQGSFTAPATPGSYRYTYRMSRDGGAHWTYCDLNGAGSIAGQSFDVTRLGALTVTP